MKIMNIACVTVFKFPALSNVYEWTACCLHFSPVEVCEPITKLFVILGKKIFVFDVIKELKFVNR